MPQSARGFTLIELSIVLVIIGLVAGGILVGRDLIKNAERRSVIKEINTLKLAITTFKLKYGALPGDMTNATSIWGKKPGADCDNVIASQDERTCDGNGDGQITFEPPGSNDEGWCIWQHLSNAQVIPDRYTCSSMSSPTIGRAAVSNDPYLGRYWIEYSDNGGSQPPFHIPSSNTIQMAGQGVVNYPALYPADAQYYDEKLDDGLPFVGGMQAVNYLTFPGAHQIRFQACTTGLSEDDTYNVTNTNINCMIGIKTEY